MATQMYGPYLPNSVPSSGQKLYTPPSVLTGSGIQSFLGSLTDVLKGVSASVVTGADAFFDIKEAVNGSKRQIKDGTFDTSEKIPLGNVVGPQAATILVVAGVGMAAVALILLLRK